MESEESTVHLSAVQQGSRRNSGVFSPLKQSEMRIFVHVFIYQYQDCILHSLSGRIRGSRWCVRGNFAIQDDPSGRRCGGGVPAISSRPINPLQGIPPRGSSP